MKGNWCVYASIVDLYALNPERFEKEEYGIEFGIMNRKTNEIKDVSILIHETDRTLKACEDKIREVQLKHGDHLPPV